MDVTLSHCPFCSPAPERVFYDGPLVLGLWDAYPASPGHALLIPRRHIASWFDASPEEKAALISAIECAKAAIEAHHSPDAYNIGINVGRAAGQTIFHLHVHVIPRYEGDVRDPRGGVRHVIPAKGNYVLGVQDHGPAHAIHTERLLVSGGATEPFLHHLKVQLATATAVDIAVAFVMQSGMELLQSAIAEALSRGTRVRLLTGDYLDATDPIALLQLLDLEPGPGAIDRRVYQTRGAPKSGFSLVTPCRFHAMSGHHST